MSVFVVGAIHHDVIVDAPALPRLDETLSGSAVRYAFGGKGGNQAVQAARIGKALNVTVAMAGCVGQDAPGTLMLETLRQAGVDTSSMQQSSKPTGMSVAISLPDGSYGAVIISSSNKELDVQSVHIPADTSWLVLQNELPEQANEALARRAKNHGIKTLLNAAPARKLSQEFAQALDLLVVNRVEAADLLSMRHDAINPREAAKILCTQWRCDVIVTLGGDGLVVCQNGQVATLSAHDVAQVSTHGAGDAFIGALAVHLTAGHDLIAAAKIANAAAALHVASPVDARADITLADIYAFAGS